MSHFFIHHNNHYSELRAKLIKIDISMCWENQGLNSDKFESFVCCICQQGGVAYIFNSYFFR